MPSTTVRVHFPSDSRVLSVPVGARLTRGYRWHAFEWCLDLRAVSPERLHAEAKRCVVCPEGWGVRMGLWPVADSDRPLQEQVDALFGPGTGLRIGFYVVGTGWARAVVAAGTRAVTVGCSDLEDALRDLVAFACEVVEQGEARCAFQREPGETRWLFGEGRLRLLDFSDLYDRSPDTAGREILGVVGSREQLGNAVLRCVDAVEERYGQETYETMWPSHPFPEVERDRLRELLEST